MSSFKILTVCTGNICRSPLAELLLKQSLQDLPVTVTSAGTYAMVGHGMPSEQVAIARALGADNPEGHRATQLDDAVAVDIDLVLAMAREHRSATVDLAPKLLRKSFTIRELARIISQIPEGDFAEITATDADARLRQAVEIANINRGTALPPASPDDEDVLDPYQRSASDYDLSKTQLVDALNTVTAFFRRVMV